MKSFHRIVLSLLAFGIAAGISAQELTGTLKKIKDTGTITIGYRDASIPFSYLDDSQKPIGYSMDLCYKIVDAVKAQLKLPDLKVALQPVTSATRIPLIANGTVDMECGSTTNNLERQQQVSFVVTTFVTANRLMSKAKNKVVNLEDLKGKTLVSTSGTSNLKQVTELNGSKNLGINIVTASDHPAAFQMVESDRAAAFAMDDILLYSLVAQSTHHAAGSTKTTFLGVIQKLGMDFVHLCLPMEFEPERRCETVLGDADPREADGEARGRRGPEGLAQRDEAVVASGSH